jgi:hypothetical protein
VAYEKGETYQILQVITTLGRFLHENSFLLNHCHITPASLYNFLLSLEWVRIRENTSECIIQLQLPDATTCTYGASDVTLLSCVLSSVWCLTTQPLANITQLWGTGTWTRMEHYWNDIDKWNPNYSKINLLQCHSLHHNPTCNSLGMNHGHRTERPAINRLTNGTATNYFLFRCLKFKLNSIKTRLNPQILSCMHCKVMNPCKGTLNSIFFRLWQ